MTARWYMVDRIGMAMLCINEADARREAANNEMMFPRNGPHRAVQLIEARAPATADQINRITYRAAGHPVGAWELDFGARIIRATEAHHEIGGAA